MKEKIKKTLEDSVKTLFPGIKIQKFQIEHPERKELGDYSTNLAFLIAKELKEKPIEIANRIATSVKKEKIFERVEVKEPGFINFFFSLDFFFKELKKIFKKERKITEKAKLEKEKQL